MHWIFELCRVLCGDVYDYLKAPPSKLTAVYHLLMDVFVIEPEYTRLIKAISSAQGDEAKTQQMHQELFNFIKSDQIALAGLAKYMDVGHDKIINVMKQILTQQKMEQVQENNKVKLDSLKNKRKGLLISLKNMNDLECWKRIHKISELVENLFGIKALDSDTYRKVERSLLKTFNDLKNSPSLELLRLQPEFSESSSFIPSFIQLVQRGIREGWLLKFSSEEGKLCFQVKLVVGYLSMLGKWKLGLEDEPHSDMQLSIIIHTLFHTISKCIVYAENKKITAQKLRQKAFFYLHYLNDATLKIQVQDLMTEFADILSPEALDNTEDTGFFLLEAFKARTEDNLPSAFENILHALTKTVIVGRNKMGLLMAIDAEMKAIADSAGASAFEKLLEMNAEVFCNEVQDWFNVNLIKEDDLPFVSLCQAHAAIKQSARAKTLEYREELHCLVKKKLDFPTDLSAHELHQKSKALIEDVQIEEKEELAKTTYTQFIKKNLTEEEVLSLQSLLSIQSIEDGREQRRFLRDSLFFVKCQELAEEYGDIYAEFSRKELIGEALLRQAVIEKPLGNILDGEEHLSHLAKTLYPFSVEDIKEFKKSKEAFLGTIFRPRFSSMNHPLIVKIKPRTWNNSAVSKKEIHDYLFHRVQREKKIFNLKVKSTKTDEADIFLHHQYAHPTNLLRTLYEQIRDWHQKKQNNLKLGITQVQDNGFSESNCLYFKTTEESRSIRCYFLLVPTPPTEKTYASLELPNAPSTAYVLSKGTLYYINQYHCKQHVTCVSSDKKIIKLLTEKIGQPTKKAQQLTLEKLAYIASVTNHCAPGKKQLLHLFNSSHKYPELFTDTHPSQDWLVLIIKHHQSIHFKGFHSTGELWELDTGLDEFPNELTPSALAWLADGLGYEGRLELRIKNAENLFHHLLTLGYDPFQPGEDGLALLDNEDVLNTLVNSLVQEKEDNAFAKPLAESLFNTIQMLLERYSLESIYAPAISLLPPFIKMMKILSEYSLKLVGEIKQGVPLWDSRDPVQIAYQYERWNERLKDILEYVKLLRAVFLLGQFDNGMKKEKSLLHYFPDDISQVNTTKYRNCFLWFPESEQLYYINSDKNREEIIFKDKVGKLYFEKEMDCIFKS